MPKKERHADCYRNIEILIQNETENVRKAEMELAAEQDKMKEADTLLTAAEKVMGGTYVQSLVSAERDRRETKYVLNGFKPA